MKKIVISLMFLISIFILSGCDNEKKIEKNNNLSYFSYSYGSEQGYFYEYLIVSSENKGYLSISGVDDKEIEINKEINIKKIKELEKIIEKQEIEKWNGFNGSDNGVDDGSGFSLEIKFDSGKTIKASGYMKYPNNYDETHTILESFLKSL